MSARTKQLLIGFLGLVFLSSLVLVQWLEVTRRQQEAGLAVHPVSIPGSSQSCVACHVQTSPGIIDHWKGSTHAVKGVGCVECHQAQKGDIDAFDLELTPELNDGIKAIHKHRPNPAI